MPYNDDQKIDVVITCFNDGAFIEQAVHSVVRQTAADLIRTILIIDDGSDQATLRVLEAIGDLDSRVIVEFGPGGGGPSKQRNRAVQQTTGEYIAFLDGDDIWESEKLENQIAMLRNTGSLLNYTGYSAFSDHDGSRSKRARVIDITGARNLALEYFLNDPPIIPSSVLMTRELFVRLGGFDEDIRVFEDTDFFLRAALIAKFSHVPTSLVRKRYRRESITGRIDGLLAHHGIVAFKATQYEPSLTVHVGRRLSERARKLGNVAFLSGDRGKAVWHLRIAVGLHVANWRAWLALVAVSLIPLKVLAKIPSVRMKIAAMGFKDEN